MSSSMPESAAAGAAGPTMVPPALDWNVMRRQLAGILRLELRRNLLGRRAFALYFLAFTPVLIVALSVLLVPREVIEQQNPYDAVPVFAWIFDLGLLRTLIFLSTLILFMSLFRAEILQRSLHYYLLTPVRREVLVAGKYFSAMVSVCLVVALATAALYLLTFIPWGVGELGRFLFQGPGFGNLLAYVGIAMLGCAGYGAIFLLAGILFRNPVVPAMVILGWEFVNFLLPPLLKKISVIHYLQSLYPVPLVSKMAGGFWRQFFEVTVSPTPAWISVPGILLFTLAVLALAGWRARRMEISYGGD